MNNIKDVYLKLKKEFKKYKISYYNQGEIIIKDDILKIYLNDSILNLDVKKKGSAHYHFESETFDEIYSKTVFYLLNYKKILIKKRITNIIIITIVCILIFLLSIIFNK